MVHFAFKCLHLLQMLAFGTMGSKWFLLLMTESADKISSFFEHLSPDMLKADRPTTKKADVRKATHARRPQTTPKSGQLDDPYMNARSITDEGSVVNKNIWTEFGQFGTNSHYRWSARASGNPLKALCRVAKAHFTVTSTGADLLICNQQVTGSSPVAGSI